MTHTPYGYNIENGVAVVDETRAEQVRMLFHEYMDCKSMRAAAVKADIHKTHSVVGRILKNKVYLGTDYYPQIIEEEVFSKVQELREGNARSQNRIRPYDIKTNAEIGSFKIGRIDEKYSDPYKQAGYAYGQITEVIDE